MKLRNRRTGEIVELSNEEFDAYKVFTKLLDNADWVEHKSAEPLIKDEKIRKAVRAWAEANEIERVWHECSSFWLRGDGLTIELENEVAELEQGNYSIDELCGEEEE